MTLIIPALLRTYQSHRGFLCHRFPSAYSPRRDVTINGVLLKKGEKLFFEEAYKYGPEERDQLWRDAKLLQSTEVGNGSDDYRE